MKLTILGSGSGQGEALRNPSAYVLETGRSTGLIDAGDGVLPALRRLRMELSSIDFIFITHTHADHVGGLFFLLQGIMIEGRNRPLSLWLPPEAAAKWSEAIHWFRLSPEKWAFELAVKSWRHEAVINQDNVAMTPVAHDHCQSASGSLESCSLLIQLPGYRLAYSSDMKSLDHWAGRLSGVDCWITEAAHIEVEATRQMAQLAGIKNVVLTHLPHPLPTGAEEAETWAQLASDGLIVNLSP